ncbi:MAG: SLC13 family permease [Oscillospiraceae bacterium]
MSQLTICIIIFAFSLISYALNKIPMGLTALITLVALVLTNCLDAGTALSGFSSTSTVIIVGMFVISAALNRTSFVDKMSEGIVKICGGSFKRAYFGYIILAALLTNFITSPMVAFSIIFPLATTMCEQFDVSPSKVQFPLAVVCIGCCAILPFGYAINATGQYNGFLEAYGFQNISINPIDFTIGRLPLLFIIILWAYFLAPKFSPDKPIVPIANKSIAKGEKKPLNKFSDIAGLVIFFGVISCLIFGKQLGFTSWKIVIIGALLTVLCRTLTEKEAFSAIPLSIVFIYAGALATANALGATGAGEVVGNWLAGIVGGTHNNYILGALFFIVPFVVTQFMLNQGVMNIFVPICLLTCQSLGANPVGLCVLITAACLTAFMTPMATPAIPICMGAGGYDIRSLFKQGWLISVLLMVGYVFYTMTVLPAF